MLFFGLLGVGSIAAIIGAIIAFFAFMGICLLVIGFSGMAMNRIYKKQTGSNRSPANRFCNIASVILGILPILSIFVVILQGIATGFSS